MRVGQPQRRGVNLSPFIYFVCPSPPPSSPLHPAPRACTVQTGLAKKGHVYFTWSSLSGLRSSFCSIFLGFSLSLSFSHCYFGLFFSYSNYLTYWSVHFWLAYDFNICHFWPISLNVAKFSFNFMTFLDPLVSQFLQTLQCHLLTLFKTPDYDLGTKCMF